VIVSSAGGTATRLTNSPGAERKPEVFSGWENGSHSRDPTTAHKNVYCVSVEGGEPAELHFNPEAGQVVGWTRKRDALSSVPILIM